MTLINILTGIGLIFFVLLLFMQREGSYIQGIFLLLFSLFIGLSGLIMIIKREVNYTVINLEGLPAMILGSIILIASMIFTILFLTGILRYASK